MKVAITLATLALGLATAGLAYAEEPYYPMINAPSVATRAQVVQQLHQAENDGLANAVGHQPYYPTTVAHSSKSRTQVLSELRLSETTGELQSGKLPYYPRSLQHDSK
ncbi:hypothetical protein CDEF62S_00573 [Castellaniella defragrans]